MLDIRPLEEKWKKYKKKERRPWYKWVSIMLILGGLISFSFYKKINLFQLKAFFSKAIIFIDIKKEKKKTPTLKYVMLVNPYLYKLQVEVIKKKSILTPIKIKKESLFEDIPILSGLEDDETSNDDIEIKSSLHSVKKLNIEMIDIGNIVVYKDIEKRFLQTHDIDDALFLATTYYKKRNYIKAKYWALQTNKLDETVEESFFIFIKSKIKLGQKNEAIAILMSYLQKTNSKEAKKLLYRIKKNRL